MSETGKSVDLTLLKKFDFKTPFTVEITYESDDDKSSTNEIERNKKNQAEDLVSTLNDIIEDLTKASKETNQMDNASNKKRKLSIESNPAKRTKTTKEVDEYEITQITETLNVEYQALNIENDQVVTSEALPIQISYDNQTITLYASQTSNNIENQVNNQLNAPNNQNKLQSQQIMTNTISQDTINNTGICSVNNNYTANNCQSTEVNNNEQTLNSCLNNGISTNNSIHQINSLSQMIISPNQVDLHIKASACVEMLLVTLSNHLILIMKSWKEYTQVYKSTNRPLVETAYKQYRETKNHFFQQSFTFVNHTLLAKENDHVFIKKFIEFTIDAARSKYIYFTYQDMKKMLNELFAWVKGIRYPILNELLHPQVQTHAQGHNNNADNLSFRNTLPSNESLHPQVQTFTHGHNNNNNRSTKNQDRQYGNTNNASNVRFSSELPGRNSVIGANSITGGTTQSVANLNTSAQSFTYNETFMQNRGPVPQSLTNLPSYVEEFQAFTRQDIPGSLRGVTEDRNIYGGRMKRGTRQRTTQKKRYPVRSVQEVQTQILQPPPSYENSVFARCNISENQPISSAQFDSFQTDNQACEVNRSLSRDSGIVSPRSPANDLNYPPVAITPLITHVTSLNPNATQLKDGVCIVCGVATKQICLGCYKTYYCSNQCQVYDWRNHVNFCK